MLGLGFGFFWPCGPCLASCDFWLTTGSFLLLRRAFVSLSAASVKSVVKVVLSTCDSQLSISFMSVFMFSLKWSRIVSIAVCARVKALGSSGCGFLVLGLFASNLPLPTFDSVHHPRPSVKSVVKLLLPTSNLRLPPRPPGFF